MSFPVVHESLVSATLTALRKRILQRKFGQHLLPERQLCQELGVSRPTLRTALKQLEKEGLLSVNGRQGRAILRSKKKSTGNLPGATVRMLQNNTPASFLNEHLQIQEYLAEHLRAPETQFHVETAPSCYSKKPEKALEAFVRSRPANLWILYLATEPMQQWFKNHGLPCVLLGSRHEGIDFISVDEDYRATCRHAAGVFLARGHRYMGLITSEIKRPGDAASRNGFESAIANSRRDDIAYYVTSHDETSAHICKAVDWLLSRPKQPTAWLVLNARTYLTVFSRLAQLGIRVGNDISLICRNSDPYFESLVPTVAHYRRNMPRMNQCLLKAVHQHLINAPEEKRQFLISSHFCDGESLCKI
jgi:DNA-binding LacI/PurR family transcriptional regulator